MAGGVVGGARAGGAGLGLHRFNAQQSAERLDTEGRTDGETERLQALSADPAFAGNSLPPVGARGRRPELSR